MSPSCRHRQQLSISAPLSAGLQDPARSSRQTCMTAACVWPAESFQGIKRWLNELDSNVSHGIPTILVGNKCDLQHLRSVEAAKAHRLCVRKVRQGRCCMAARCGACNASVRCFGSVVRTNCEELQHGTQQVRSTAAVEGGDRMKADSMSWAAMAGLQRGAAMEHRACQQLWRAEQELLWCGVGVVQR